MWKVRNISIAQKLLESTRPIPEPRNSHKKCWPAAGGKFLTKSEIAGMMKSKGEGALTCLKKRILESKKYNSKITETGIEIVS